MKPVIAALLIALLFARAAGAAEPAAPAPPAAGDAQATPGESSARDQSREQYLALFIGSASMAPTNTRASAGPSCILWSCSSARSVESGDAGFSDAGITGIRYGMWARHWGLAMEYDRHGGSDGNSAQNPGTRVRLSYQAFMVLALARTSFFPGPDAPDGRMDLYGGGGLGDVRVDVSFQSPSWSPSGSARGLGKMGLLGVAYKSGPYRIFVETRVLDVAVDGNDGWGGADLHTHLYSVEKVLGVAISF